MCCPWSAPDVQQARNVPLAKILANVCDYKPRDIGAAADIAANCKNSESTHCKIVRTGGVLDAI
jgi:hypothetical protein